MIISYQSQHKLRYMRILLLLCSILLVIDKGHQGCRYFTGDRE